MVKERPNMDSGVEWETLPTPPQGLRAPDRSHRRPIGPLPEEGGRPCRGVFAGTEVYDWIRDEDLRPEPRCTNEDGSAWYQDVDGSLWYVDAHGEIFYLADNGTFMALSYDGLLWTQAGGHLIAHTADGTSLSLHRDGSLHAFDAAGNEWIVGEDGSYYAKGPFGSFFTLGPDGRYYSVDDDGTYSPIVERPGFSDADLGRRIARFSRKEKARTGWRTAAVALLATAAMFTGFYGTHTGPFQPCVKNGAGMQLCGGVGRAYCREVSDPLIGRSASCNRILGEHERLGSGINRQIASAR